MSRLTPAATLESWFWKGCKPNSVCTLASGENHLSKRPIPETCLAFTKRGAGNSSVSYLALHPMGFSMPCRLRFTRCALTAPFHHHRRLAPEAVYFLWHFPSARLETCRLRVSQPNELELRSIAPCGVRTFLPGLAPGAILHPSKTIASVADGEKISRLQVGFRWRLVLDRRKMRRAAKHFRKFLWRIRLPLIDSRALVKADSSANQF